MMAVLSSIWHFFVWLCVFNCFMNWLAWFLVSDETIASARPFVPDAVADVWEKRKPPHFQTIMCIIFLIILIQTDA